MNERRDPVFSAEYVGSDNSVCREVIGKSWLGKEIYSFRLGRGGRRIVFCADGGGGKYRVTPLLTSWMSALSSAEKKGTPFCGCNVKNLLEKCTLYVIPCINPDGAEIAMKGVDEGDPFYERLKRMCGKEDFSHWEANVRGIDIRRNFNSRWVEGKLDERRRQKLFPSYADFGGEYPESEFETSALCLMVKREKPDIYVTVTVGEGKIIGFYPDGAQEERRGAEVCSSIMKIPHSIAEKEDFYGSPEGWFCSLFGRSAFRISLPSDGNTEGVCTMFSAII